MPPGQFRDQFVVVARDGARPFNSIVARLNLICRYCESLPGLLDFLTTEVGDAAIYDAAYYKSQYLEFALTHTANYGETYFSFVNGQYTSDGGSHQSAFREGVLKGVNEFYKKILQISIYGQSVGSKPRITPRR